MNKKRIISLASAAALLMTALAVYVEGDELIWDSTADPLVSLSYINESLMPELDKRLAELGAKIDALSAENAALKTENTELKNKNSEQDMKLNALIESNNALKSSLDALASEPDSGYEVVTLSKGQKLLAETPCELILRGGSAIVVSITVNGVNDVTDGTELLNAVNIPLYHSLIVPRGGDGRGIQVTSEAAYIMVRGGYQLVD